jgi:sarcosine oxidase subunit alpha
LKILAKRGPRQKLVGIEIPDQVRLPRESQLVIDKGNIAGRITSVVRSRTLNKSIGLAMVAPELAEAGTEIKIRADQGAMLAARIVPTPFYDPKNLRQRGDVGA